jgi:hypothetical protein
MEQTRHKNNHKKTPPPLDNDENNDDENKKSHKKSPPPLGDDEKNVDENKKNPPPLGDDESHEKNPPPLDNDENNDDENKNNHRKTPPPLGGDAIIPNEDDRRTTNFSTTFTFTIPLKSFNERLVRNLGHPVARAIPLTIPFFLRIVPWGEALGILFLRVMGGKIVGLATPLPP